MKEQAFFPLLGIAQIAISSLTHSSYAPAYFKQEHVSHTKSLHKNCNGYGLERSRR